MFFRKKKCNVNKESGDKPTTLIEALLAIIAAYIAVIPYKFIVYELNTGLTKFFVKTGIGDIISACIFIILMFIIAFLCYLFDIFVLLPIKIIRNFFRNRKENKGYINWRRHKGRY